MPIVNLPVISQIWSAIRRKRIIAKHREVASFWHPVITAYFSGELDKYDFLPVKKELVGKKIIWQYWGQGVEHEGLPEIVQLCFDSIDKYKGGYEVIRLSDETIHEYLELPTFVWERRKNLAFNRTFFSDLLRLALLKTYGGIWLDATIMLTGEIPERYSNTDYFVFQRDRSEQNKKYWESTYAYYWGWHPQYRVNMLNSIFFGREGDETIKALLDLMLFYWKTQDKIIDYFFFQILYDELLSGKLKEHKCSLVSDVLPHYLQSKVNGGCDFISYKEIFEKNSLHKMSYFDKESLNRLCEVLSI
ncbi:MAG: capsular polysaccharide synthesis protein [Dysgonamonadaceae bacterium]